MTDVQVQVRMSAGSECESHRCGAAKEKARLAEAACRYLYHDDLSDRLGTTEKGCAFRYNGDDVLRVLKVTNASLMLPTGRITPASASSGSSNCLAMATGHRRAA